MDKDYHFCDAIPNNTISINKDNEYEKWILEATRFSVLGGEGVSFIIPIKFCPFCSAELI